MSGLIIISTFMCMQLSLLGLASLRLAIEDLRTFQAMETRGQIALFRSLAFD